jgi:glycosyltransferase involved in cell wall biosynthesis
MIVGVDGRSLVAPGPRGVAQYTAGMLAALAAAEPGTEWRVSLPGAGANLPPATTAVRHRVPSRVLHGAGALARRPRLDRLLDRPDVVWLPAPAPTALSRDARLMLTVHDLSFEERPGDYTRYERAWHAAGRLGALARRAARVAADTAATADAVHARWRVPHDRIAVVPAGAGDPGPPADAEQIEAIRARLQLPERWFLYVGALEPRKAVDVLAAAYGRARAQGLDAGLVLAGEGRLETTLNNPGVHLAGRVSPFEKAALYAGALAVVLPSWAEGYGYPLVEGFAHGVPAVASDLPALRETAGGGALHVPPGDEAALAAALLRLAHDGELRATLARAGAARAAGLTYANAAQALLTLLREAAA